MKVFTVSELTFAIKSVLEPQFRSLQLCGEISNFKLQSSGHLYFSLKDANAQISAVLFRNSAASLTRMPKEGDQVTVQGELSLYAPRGNYQIVIRSLQFTGQGELLLKLQQLKDELHKRGWFNAEHKKSLPKFPKRIGVVTSPTGAVIQDILNVLQRRFATFHLILNPVKVQGVGAAQEIAQAIYDFNTYQLADVLIIGRGGGSIEDLWAFNEEIVAKAIFDSRIPIISAVGHETDVTISDFVADVRAPTPSAAAEMAIAEKSHVLQFLERTRQFLQQRIGQKIHEQTHRLKALQRHPLLSSPHTLLRIPMQKLDDLREQIEFATKRSLKEHRLRIQTIEQKLALVRPLTKITSLQKQLGPYPERLAFSFRQMLETKKRSLTTLSAHLRSLNPKNLTQKGYAILRSQEGGVILSAQTLKPNQSFTVLLHDGRIDAVANKVESHVL